MSSAEENESGGNKKSSPLTPFEKTLLFDLVDEKKATLENKKTVFGTTKTKKQTCWETVAKNFCSQQGTSKRDSQQLKKAWENAKSRAKKATKDHKQKIRKTGGGPAPPALSTESIRVMSIVPAQMEALENEWDCDMQEAASSTLTTTLVALQPATAAVTQDSARPTSTNNGSNTNVADPMNTRHYKDARSALVDMEHEEHTARLSTIQLEQDYIKLKIKIANRKLELMEEEHELKKNFLTAQISGLPNVQFITE